MATGRRTGTRTTMAMTMPTGTSMVIATTTTTITTTTRTTTGKDKPMAAERDTEGRERLAQALAMLERAELIDFNGHFSARLADGRGLLINAADSVRSAIRPEDFIAIDFDGRVLAGDRTPPMEFHLHAQIYLRRPDVHAVVHTHPRWSTVLTSAGLPWQPVTMQAAVLGAVDTFPKTVSINSAALGREVADFLGERKAALMHRHGAVAAGADIADVFAFAVYMEENAHRQYLACQIGTPEPLSAAECESIGRNLARPALLRKVWDFHAAKLAAVGGAH